MNILSLNFHSPMNLMLALSLHSGFHPPHSDKIPVTIKASNTKLNYLSHHYYCCTKLMADLNCVELNLHEMEVHQ